MSTNEVDVRRWRSAAARAAATCWFVNDGRKKEKGDRDIRARVQHKAVATRRARHKSEAWALVGKNDRWSLPRKVVCRVEYHTVHT